MYPNMRFFPLINHLKIDGHIFMHKVKHILCAYFPENDCVGREVMYSIEYSNVRMCLHLPGIGSIMTSNCCFAKHCSECQHMSLNC